MSISAENLLPVLASLISFDTQNPPRNVTADEGIIPYLKTQLPDFEHRVFDYGDGCLALLAVRGAPRTLINVHIDTVPGTQHWSQSPFELKIMGDKAVGLGSCDIKGAAAGLVIAARASAGPAAFLFTTDEEAGSSRCIREFVKEDDVRGYDQVIVCEPTQNKAILQHRGINSFEVTFTGSSAHTSAPSEGRSAVHDAAAWMAACLEYADDNRYNDDLRLNFGRVEGGLKPNMRAPDCLIRFGFRAPPGARAMDISEALFERAPEGSDMSATPRFSGPALPCASDAEDERLTAAMTSFVQEQSIPIGPAVDFWTEAALFHEARFPVCVYGPGDIAQAHTPDEWVLIDSLLEACETYKRVIENG